MRFAYRLPVTALELNSLAHAICALLIYALWWGKPLDISEPTMLRIPLPTQEKLVQRKTSW